MPSHKIHIYIEEQLNKKLKLDEDLFKLGNVLPDLVKGKHSVGHFKVSKAIYDFDTFINNYRNELEKKNPIALGYLIHLLVDEYYNRYIREKYFVYGDDSLPCGINKNNKIIYMDRDKIFDLKHEDLENYDIHLLKTYKFIPFQKESLKTNLFDVDQNEIDKYIKIYNHDITNVDNLKENEYQFLDKEELTDLISKTIIYVEEYLKKNILEKSNKMYYTYSV